MISSCSAGGTPTSQSRSCSGAFLNRLLLVQMRLKSGIVEMMVTYHRTPGCIRGFVKNATNIDSHKTPDSSLDLQNATAAFSLSK